MKTLLTTTVILLATTFGLSAQAQEKVLFTHSGGTCLQGGNYSAAEILSKVSLDATQFINSQCKETEDDLDDTLEVDLKYAGRCPYGHRFEYNFKIKCQAR